ncbi:MAG: hypothetical protein BWK80_57315 [Desulfobacteraceae bacterium IS3]|nr:MAG: hypothetical protein BWK80_57315 [Desulfobacteraceae bacterium IS3]
MIFLKKSALCIVMCFCVLSVGYDFASGKTYHSADYNPSDYNISISELLRVIQFYNVGAFHCSPNKEGGYDIGTGDPNCSFHDSDYNPQDWKITLNELLRLTQLYNAGLYHVDASKEDGFDSGAGPGTPEPEGIEICGDEIDQDGDGRDNLFSIDPEKSLVFKIGVRQQDVARLCVPYSFDIKMVKKDGKEIQLSDNVVFDKKEGKFSWTPTSDQAGEYEFVFLVKEACGYDEVEITAYIVVKGTSSKQIAEVSASPAFINPAAGEKTTISYTLDKPSAVTIELYKASVAISGWGDGIFRRELQMTLLNNQSRPAGENSEIWDGKGADGKILEPSAYVYVIKAANSDKTYTYDPEYVSGLADISKFTVSPLKFNPYANQSLELKYSLLQPAWMIIGGNGMPGFAVAGKPRDKGENIEKWDGRAEIWDENGNTGKTLIVTGTLNLAAKAEILPENAIVIKEQDSALITNVSTEAYIIVPSYGEISTVKYTLSENSLVSISISDPNGNNWTLAENETQSKGEHSAEWRGVNADGKLVWPLTNGIPEGDYTVEIKAESKESGATAVKRANIHVYR